jgi:hypothetical protein
VRELREVDDATFNRGFPRFTHFPHPPSRNSFACDSLGAQRGPIERAFRSAFHVPKPIILIVNILLLLDLWSDYFIARTSL